MTSTVWVVTLSDENDEWQDIIGVFTTRDAAEAAALDAITVSIERLCEYTAYVTQVTVNDRHESDPPAVSHVTTRRQPEPPFHGSMDAYKAWKRSGIAVLHRIDDNA